MFKKILLGLAVVVAGFCAFVATRPEDFKVERSLTMAAPPEVVFAQVNDFHNWSQWSPWEKLDPSMKKEFGGPPSGVGSTYGWVGNEKVGEGKMTITQSTPPSQVVLTLEFLKPFASVSTTHLMVAAAPGGSKLTWSMSGKNNFMAKAFSVFADMDKLVGKDFEVGLKNIQGIAEPLAKQQAEEAAKKAAEAAPAEAPAAAPAAPADAPAPHGHD